MMHRSTLRTIALLVVVGGFLAVVALAPLRAWSSAFLNWVRDIGFAGPALLAAAYVPTSVFLVPVWWMTIGSGFAFGPIVGAVAASLGSLLGASVSFWLGRTIARELVERRVARSRKFAALDRAIADHGFKIVFLTRLSPLLPFNMLNYIFGASHIRFRDFALATWSGMLPSTLLYVWLGTTLQNVAALEEGRPTKRLVNIFMGVLAVVATVAATLLITRISRRALHDSVPEAEELLLEPETVE